METSSEMLDAVGVLMNSELLNCPPLPLPLVDFVFLFLVINLMNMDGDLVPEFAD